MRPVRMGVTSCEVIFVRMLVVASRCESGPGSCQEARSQAGGSAGKGVGSNPSVKSPAGGATEPQAHRG